MSPRQPAQWPCQQAVARPIVTTSMLIWANKMAALQYYLALVMIMFAPATFTLWFIIHPFIGFWRGLGVMVSYTIFAVYLLLMAGLIYLYRDFLLASHYGFSAIGFSIGVVLISISLLLRISLERKLGSARLSGLHELRGDHSDSDLIRTGIYAYIRHPRYLEGMILMASFALLTNYLALYVVWLLSMPLLNIIARLEERELIQRFGDAYLEYMVQVPRFIPRRRA